VARGGNDRVSHPAIDTEETAAHSILQTIGLAVTRSV